MVVAVGAEQVEVVGGGPEDLPFEAIGAGLARIGGDEASAFLNRGLEVLVGIVEDCTIQTQATVHQRHLGPDLEAVDRLCLDDLESRRAQRGGRAADAQHLRSAAARIVGVEAGLVRQGIAGGQAPGEAVVLMVAIDEVAVVDGRLRRQAEQRQDRRRQIDRIGIGQTAQQSRNLCRRHRALQHGQKPAGDGTAVGDRTGVARGLVVAGVANPAREFEAVGGLEGQVGEQVVGGQFGAVDRYLDVRRLQVARDRRGQGPCPQRRQCGLQELRRHHRIGRDRQGVVADRRGRAVQQSGQLGQGDAFIELGRGALVALLAEPAGPGEARQAPATVPVQAELLAPLLAIGFFRRRQQRQRQTVGVEGFIGVELAIGRGRVQRQ
ncbi:hypothetical protein D3C72_648840 [compost metagenome]